MELIAQTTNAAEVPWMQLVTGLGTGGVLVWFMYYTLTVIMPKFAEEVKQISRDHNDTVKQVVDKFNDSLRDERESRIAEAKFIRESFQCKAK